MNDRESVESYGEPVPESKPIDLPCQGPGCDNRVVTHLTDEDIAARETVQVLRYTPEAGDERLVRYWFCSADCRAAFVTAVENGEREETLYEADQ